jgi:hypothetical protein
MYGQVLDCLVEFHSIKKEVSATDVLEGIVYPQTPLFAPNHINVERCTHAQHARTIAWLELNI